MQTRTLLNAGVLVLLLVLAVEAAGIARSLRRIEHEQRRLVKSCRVERPAYFPVFRYGGPMLGGSGSMVHFPQFPSKPPKP